MNLILWNLKPNGTWQEEFENWLVALLFGYEESVTVLRTWLYTFDICLLRGLSKSY